LNRVQQSHAENVEDEKTYTREYQPEQKATEIAQHHTERDLSNASLLTHCNLRIHRIREVTFLCPPCRASNLGRQPTLLRHEFGNHRYLEVSWARVCNYRIIDVGNEGHEEENAEANANHKETADGRTYANHNREDKFGDEEPQRLKRMILLIGARFHRVYQQYNDGDKRHQEIAQCRDQLIVVVDIGRR
jgi:hypothetical protein